MCADNLTTPNGHQVVIRQLSANDDLIVPLTGEEYVGLLWAADETFDESSRMNLVTTLINTGCRYLVCSGADCERWHDDADVVIANLEVSSAGNVPFVMTTWHHNESVEDVAFFATYGTNFGDHDFKFLLALVVGRESERADFAIQLGRALLDPSGRQNDPSAPAGSL